MPKNKALEEMKQKLEAMNQINEELAHRSGLLENYIEEIGESIAEMEE